jgi:hypothetical protein
MSQMAIRSRSPASPHSTTSFEQARAALSMRLRERRAEIEQAVLTRAYAIDDPGTSIDPEYLEGLRASIAAAVDFGLAVIEQGEERAAVPPLLLAQARLAARYGVGLDTVLRRYSAGYVVLSDFLIEEAESSGLHGAALQRILRARAVLDRLLAAVSEEYMREAGDRPGTSEQRRAERIERLLAGEPIDTSEFAYDFEGFHVGAIGSGFGVEKALGILASFFNASLLVARRDDGTVWAWLGRRRPFDAGELLCHASIPAEAALAIGEPGKGIADWRLTHRQARAAMTIAIRGPQRMVRYADVALLVAVLKDDLLTTSLRALYLEPLEVERDGGEVLRETLRAYFAAERNVSSAAAALNVNRHTVSSRLRVAEERLGCAFSECATEVDLALRLERFRMQAAEKENS